MRDVREMLGREVEVLAHGMTYRGVLVEVSDTEVHLRTPLQWVSLPASIVGEIKLREASSRATADRINVEPSSGDDR
jgi:hypothetical protein